jgi:glycosyltransferase involved in cell wall biosynthesis
MQVAYDARPLIERGTGIGRYVRCLLEALLGFDEMREFLLCSPRQIAAGDALSRDARVRELVQKGWKGNVWLQAVVPFLLKRHRPDLFHGTLFLHPLLSGHPSIVNIYDLTVYRYPETMEARNKWPLKLLLPRAVSRAKRIVTLSEFTKKEIAERWPEASGKIDVVPGAPYLSLDVPSGTSSEEDSEKVLEKYGVRRPYLLYVGTMEPRKNVVRLLKAFELLNRMGEKGVQLVLVGHEGWGLDEVREAWESSPVKSSIQYIGYVPDEVLGHFYRQAELFVFLSLYEGFGLPPLEAMAAGTCVVASDRASLPECLGDAGVRVDPLNVEAVAEAVFRLLRDADLRRDHADRGLGRAKEFSWRKSAEKTLSVYKELV